MIDDVLYIIGNGFDLHHGVESSYACFRDWLKHHNLELFYVYSNICRYDALWSDFENGLAFVDRDYFISGAELFLPDYSKDPDDWQMADIFLAGDSARSLANNLVDDLKSAFYRWIKSLRAPRGYKDKMIRIDDYARFLSFNYTDFLETQYGINHDNIKYIHGVRGCGKNSIIVGHGGDDEAFDQWWSSKQYDKRKTGRKGKRYFNRDGGWKTYRSYLPEYEGIANGLQEYYEESQKPVDRILRDSEAYFSDLYDIRTIYVLGFSFNRIDMPYIQRIIDCNDNPDEIRWNVSYYSQEELSGFKETMARLGIDIDSKVNFHPLAFWQIH